MKTKTPLTAAILFAAMAIACILNTPSAFAATRTWNGGATPDGNWTNPGNWNGVAPTTNDLLIFSGTTQTKTTNNFASGMLFNNITFNSGAAAFTIYGNPFTLSEPTDAGSGQIANGSINNLSANTQTFLASVLITNGNHTISSSIGTLKFNVPVNRSVGAVVNMSGHINVTGGLSTNGIGNGLLGGWAICSNNWATLDASSNVIAYAGYVDVAGGGTIANNPIVNARIPVAGANIAITTPTTGINSLFFGSPTASGANQTVTTGVGTKVVFGQNGGIYNSTPIAGAGTYRQLQIGSSVAAGGVVTAGDGVNPAAMFFGSPPAPSGSPTFLLIDSVITDNGSAPVTVVQAGAYVSMNAGGNAGTTNTFSGGTYILQGRNSQPSRYTFGTGPVYIFPGGQANTGCQVTNDVYVEGSGTVEMNGMGAVRMYAASGGTGYFGNLMGTVHLTGNAAFGANNTAFTAAGAPFIGISGKITGAGGLMISSPTATASGAGTINIGSTNGAFDIPNDYAGDTTINGTTTGGTELNSTLRIANPADNNIMPHGVTGSFAGGKTGNLILNATAANRQAIFDVNGSTQSINGLISTAASPVNDIVTDSAGGGVLVLGDSDATSVFAGSVQNGIVLNKIGNGSVTLSGANTYTGDTVIEAGRLITTTASTGNGNFSVSNNAAMGVTLATSGSTLQINNLTLVSGSSLQLNAASFGSPSTAIANVGGALNITGTVNISLSGIGLTAGGPFPILTYNAGTGTGGGSFQLATSPRLVATLTDNNAGTVSVTITSADVAVKWNGGVGGIWDTNDSVNTIWQTVPSGNPAFYIESGSGNDSVIFDDSATGTTTVNVATNVTPQTFAVTNTSQTYLFTGSSKITGGTGLVKTGGNNLIIANTGNDFSGNISLLGGALVVSNDWSVGNTITGTGALVKTGPGTLTLSGDGSAFTGPVTVNGGILSVLNTLSLATASSTIITNGGTLDIGNNNVALAQEPITVSGAGVSGNGAIVNSSGYSSGALSTSFQNLTMADNTTIGGPGRLDFRSADVNAGTDAVLSTGGHPFKLTKTSINTLNLASVQVDPALGDIDIQSGTLSLQGNMPNLGNSANTVTVFGGAIMQFNTVTTTINKAVTVQDSGVINNGGGANTFGGPITLQGNSLFNIAGTSLTLNGAVGGNGALVKVTSASPLILAAANNYSGGTVANAGLISITADNNLGALPVTPTPGNIILNGGGISAALAMTVNPNRGIAVGPASGTGAGFIDVPSTLTYNGVIANNGVGIGTLIVTNGSSLSLGGTNTYTGNTIVSQGTLALTGNGSISSSANIVLVGTTLDASGRTDGALTIAPGQTLTGNGNVTGNLTNGPGSTLAPTNLGSPIVVSGAVVMQGTNLMSINKDAGGNDLLYSSTSITYGGTLLLLLSDTNNPFVVGDAFPLYNAPFYGGVIPNIIPATPGAGLAWDTSTLMTDGNLRIMVGPTLPTTNASITKVTLSSTNVIVQGTNNNVPNTSFHYAVLTSTNITLPLSNWTPVVTNPFNPDGTFNYTNPIVPGTPRQFIEVEAVP